MDPTQVAQIIKRLAAGEKIPGWSYHPEQTTLHGESQYAQTEPTSAFYNGQGYWASGEPMRNQTLDLKEVAKLAAIMGTAYLGGNALAGMGGGGGASAVGAAAPGAATATPGLGAGAGAVGGAAGAGATGGFGATLGKMAGGKMFEFLIPAAAQLIGTGMQASAASKAAAASGAAADRATALQERIYQESIARQQPFLAGGTEDYNRLRAMMSGGPEAAQNFLQMDPGYQFRLSEGLKALDRQAAARGGLISGGALKAAQRYGQDVASQEFGSAYNRLANLANLGPQAAGVMSNLGQNYASNVGNIMMGQGNVAANAALARGSAYGQGLNQLGYLAGRYYGQPGGGGVPATGGVPTGMLPGGYEFPG